MQASCKAAVDKTVNYLKGVELYRPFPIVRPGFLVHQLPADPPQEGVKMETILEDVDRLLLPGVTHWNHPHFHAYFAMANSYPAVCADIISSAIGGIGFTWASSPVSTELEVVMTNWLVKMLGLPDFYLHNVSGGGGVIGTTCSEQAVVTMMAARNKAIEKYIADHPGATNYKAMSKLAHCSIERAGLLNLLPFRSLPVNEKFQLTGETLESAIVEDIAMGKVPFYVCLSSTLTRARKSDIKESGIDEFLLTPSSVRVCCAATLGTTSCCSFDRLEEIGPICKKYGLWLHVDAAYAGSAFICPELRRYLRGVEYTSSFAFNPHKWLLTNFDCSVVCTDAQYLKYDEVGKMPDYRNWQLSFGRKFRSIKLWFVIRKFGVGGLQGYIRQHIRMAKYLESLIRTDPRFEIICGVVLGLVCFRIKNNNEMTKELYKMIEEDGRIHLVTSKITGPDMKEIFFIRIAIVYLFTDEETCSFAYNVICEIADKLMGSYQNKPANGQIRYENVSK
ncbi:Aromatic-L-amino-acid decarboxylase [Echinococcus granulosus]|uniref:Aromatic-L-amino-acid decarboxylase n=1 Tax=Echinococcus granulosus TaxID=6210 RepID=W6U3F0_ECHGR|nr:Aromatic-L-amino-acid decarboxylase [Echinococcus granulosus]EUB55630.1 Aromatic-L-amino-acid decarboxylase [Echinococcus granulosus]